MNHNTERLDDSDPAIEQRSTLDRIVNDVRQEKQDEANEALLKEFAADAAAKDRDLQVKEAY